MQYVIYGLAGLGFIVLIACAYFLYKIVWPILKVTRTALNASHGGPVAEALMRELLSLENQIFPIFDATWENRVNVNSTVTELALQGFNPLGPYQGIHGYNPCEVLHHEDGTIALVTEVGNSSRIGICLLGILEDNTVICVSNNSMTHCLPLPSHEYHILKTSTDIPELMDSMSRAKSSKQFRSHQPVEIAAALSNIIEQRAWHVASQPQIATRAIGQLELNGTEYDFSLKETLAKLITTCCRKSYLKQAGISAHEWEGMRNQLIVVHDWLADREILHALKENYGDQSSENHKQIHTQAKEPLNREIFARDIISLIDRIRPIKIATLKHPIDADIYLSPQPHIQL